LLSTGTVDSGSEDNSLKIKAYAKMAFAKCRKTVIGETTVLKT
jgi:hypothetical protein